MLIFVILLTSDVLLKKMYESHTQHATRVTAVCFVFFVGYDLFGMF